MKHDLLQIGSFPANLQTLINEQFTCHEWEAVEAAPKLRETIRGIITRSNFVVPEAVIEALPSLGVIATCGVGYDLIPLELAARRGIRVANTPDVLNSAVAELTIGLVLSVLRRLPRADGFVKSGEWNKQAFPLSTSLAGKRVGIVGLGRIGKEIAARLEPFGVSIAYFGRSRQDVAWTYEADLAALAGSSDLLILAAPGGAGTRHMINAEILRALGSQGYLINIARGSLVDEEALLAALNDGTIAGAGLDVFENEPAIDPRFFELDNAVLTPHIGSATNETRLTMVNLTLANLGQYFENGTIRTPVPLPA